MAHYLPVNKEEFMDIKGVGEKKFESYGMIFMDLIKAFKKVEVTE